ncbi:hypothetical protein [Mycobacterium sp. 852002-40037_SCH5390672]|nr:hypothetical protein [Mycobacterium sp. 852002-40037_SCH5390672]
MLPRSETLVMIVTVVATVTSGNLAVDGASLERLNRLSGRLGI